MSKSVALLTGRAAKVATAHFDRHDPVTGQLASQAAAADALPGWSGRGPNERRALLNKAATVFTKDTAFSPRVARQLIDEKTFKPGLGTYDLTK